MSDSPNTPFFGTLVVALHAVVVVSHAVAHENLGIELTGLRIGFAGTVIVLAPLAAAALLWTSRARLGYLLLTVSMAGALAFGVYHHYIAISPDHVSHLPAGDLQGLFKLTAFLLPVSEILGIMAGLQGSRGSATTRS